MRVLAGALMTMLAISVVAGHRVVMAGAQSLDSQRVATSHSHALRLTTDPTKPLFTVGISGGFTGAEMLASVYGDGRVLAVHQGTGGAPRTVETNVPLSRGAVQAVLNLAVRSHVFAIPRSVQDAVFGADIPLLSFRITSNRGARSVHVMGTEGSHPAGSQVFFPVWNLLYAIAGYPPHIG
jgi:hypothetical protein